MFEKAKWIWVGENYKSEIYSDFYADFKIEFTSPDLLNKNLISLKYKRHYNLMPSVCNHITKSRIALLTNAFLLSVF